MTKFTKGPWVVAHVDERSKFEDGGCRIDAGDIEQLAYVWNTSNRYAVDTEKGPEFGADEFLANAALIAASPDIYEALQEMVDNFWGADAGDRPEADEALAKARAALAKAEGGGK